MDSGRNCASPRLNRGRFCYWHNRLHTEHHFPGNPTYEPPILDSANAVALALNHVYRGQSRGLIDGKTARHLQQSLRIALQAFRLLDRPLPTEMVTDLSRTADPPVHESAPCSAGVSPAVARASSPASSPVRTVNPCHPEHGRPALSGVEGTESKDPVNVRITTSSPALPKDPFTLLADSPAANTRLSPEQERNLSQLVRRSAG